MPSEGKPKRRTADDVCRELYGAEWLRIEALKNKNSIGMADAERHERQRIAKLDEERLRQAEEDEARRFPDK